jgi:iron complex outermembrane receptor protein
VAVLLLLLPGPATGQAPLRTGEVRVEDARLADEPGTPPPEPSAFVTIIDARAPFAESSLPEVLARVASVQVRSMGHLGAFTAVSIRGSTAAQVAIFLDGVPLNRDATGAPDLSQIPLGSLERIEVYRGGVPAELTGAALGGAINLVTRRPGGRPETEVRAGGGSFLTRFASVRRSGGSPRLAYQAFVGYQGSRGDFPYYDDNQTEFTTADDRTRRRQNNGYDQVAAALSGRYRHRDLEASVAGQTLWRAQGLPPFRSLLADDVTLGTVRQTLDVSVLRRRLAGGALDLGGTLYGLCQWQHFVNPGGAFVGQQDLRYLTLGGGARGRGALALGAHQVLVVVPEVRGEQFAATSAIAGQEPPPGGLRFGAALAVRDEISLLRDRLLLLPALRGDLLRTWSPDQRGVRVETYLSPRLGLRVGAHPAVAVKGNVGMYFRPPTFMELHGSPGLMLANQELAAEHGVSSDLGVQLTTRWVTAEAAGFVRRTEGLIAYERRLLLLRAVNDERVRVVPGLEALARVQPHRSVALSGSYTYTAASIPGQPRHQALARVEFERAFGPTWVPAAFYELDYAGVDYLDLGRERLMPARLLHGAGVRVTMRTRARGEVRVAVEGRNLGDLRVAQVPLQPPQNGLSATPVAVADFFGYPLPGRSILATLEWRN